MQPLNIDRLWIGAAGSGAEPAPEDRRSNKPACAGRHHVVPQGLGQSPSYNRGYKKRLPKLAVFFVAPAGLEPAFKV